MEWLVDGGLYDHIQLHACMNFSKNETKDLETSTTTTERDIHPSLVHLPPQPKLVALRAVSSEQGFLLLGLYLGVSANPTSNILQTHCPVCYRGCSIFCSYPGASSSCPRGPLPLFPPSVPTPHPWFPLKHPHHGFAVHFCSDGRCGASHHTLTCILTYRPSREMSIQIHRSF